MFRLRYVAKPAATDVAAVAFCFDGSAAADLLGPSELILQALSFVMPNNDLTYSLRDSLVAGRYAASRGSCGFFVTGEKELWEGLAASHGLLSPLFAVTIDSRSGPAWRN
jgi:hypothetical protein